MNQTLYFHNPGNGDEVWRETDRQMLLALHDLLAPDSWIIYHRPFGPPCGGYYYKLELSGDVESVKTRLAKLGVFESHIAELHFD